MWKIIKIIIGVLLLLVGINGIFGTIKTILVDSFPNANFKFGYLVGYMTPTIICLVVGIYLIYPEIKKNMSNKENNQITEIRKDDDSE